MFSKKHEMIRKLIREFAENEIAPIVARIDGTGEYPEGLHRKVTDCGFHAIVIPKEYGGCGGDTIPATTVTEELTEVDASIPTQLMPSSLSGGSLMMFGNEAQKQKYPRGMTEGRLIGVSAITEPKAGSDTAAVATTVGTDRDYYILNGRKCFVTNGPCCDSVTVLARMDVNARGVEGISAFVAESTWKGFSRGAVENEMGIHGSPACGLIFENVRVPKGNLLAFEGQDFKICMVTLDSGRITVATQDLGIAQGTLDEAVKYVKERVQFGKPILKL